MKWTSIRKKVEKQYYDGEFPNLDLVELAFDFPNEMLDDYRKRNPKKDFNFYAYTLREEHPTDTKKLYPFIGLYDPNVVNVLIKNDVSESLNRITSHILKVDEHNRALICEDFASILGLRDKITVIGYGEMVELWKPETYEEFDSTKKRGVDFIPGDDDLTGLRKKAWSQK